jgi:hypothetical protein
MRKRRHRGGIGAALQIGIVLIGEGHVGSVVHLLLVSSELLVVDGDLGRSESGSSNELL